MQLSIKLNVNLHFLKKTQAETITDTNTSHLNVECCKR